MIRLRYEIPSGKNGVNEEEIELPEGWGAMSEQERHDWCLEAIADGLGNYISTSYDWDGMEEWPWT